MRTLLFLVASALAVAFSVASPGTAATTDSINTDCPVTGMEVKEGLEVEAKGGSIGVCCQKCKAAVEAWSDTKKAEYVANYKPQEAAAAADDKKDGEAEAEGWDGDPYLLGTCAASGRPIDVKGTPTTKVIEGRELKFCCGGCAAAVEKDPAKWLGKVDEALTAQQLPIYPTDTCIISGEPLMEENDEGKMAYIGVDVMVKNRLFRVCCKMCAKKLKEDPSAFGDKLNAMVVKTQGESYPLEACVVNDKGAIDTEKAQSFVIGGRLIKTCCGGCEAKVRANPMDYVAKVDAARAEKAAKAEAGDAVKDAKEAVKKAADKAGK